MKKYKILVLISLIMSSQYSFTQDGSEISFCDRAKDLCFAAGATALALKTNVIGHNVLHSLDRVYLHRLCSSAAYYGAEFSTYASKVFHSFLENNAKILDESHSEFTSRINREVSNDYRSINRVINHDQGLVIRFGLSFMSHSATALLAASVPFLVAKSLSNTSWKEITSKKKIALYNYMSTAAPLAFIVMHRDTIKQFIPAEYPEFTFMLSAGLSGVLATKYLYDVLKPIKEPVVDSPRE